MDGSKSILYVDDEPYNLLLFEAGFKKAYPIITAASGKEGLEKLDAEDQIALVITDMKMPDMSGVDFVQEAKKRNHQKVYFILSGFDFNEEIQEGLSTGLIDRSFNKPFSFEEIKVAIDEYLGPA